MNILHSLASLTLPLALQTLYVPTSIQPLFLTPVPSAHLSLQTLSLLDVVVEALEIDCPRHCDEIRAMEPGLAWAKEVDLKGLANEAADLDKV